MSYCRFSNGDVYMYWSIAEHIECCACIWTKRYDPLDPNTPTMRLGKRRVPMIWKEEFPTFSTFSHAIVHLKKHIKAGHVVPRSAITRLIQDRKKYGDDLARASKRFDKEISPSKVGP